MIEEFINNPVFGITLTLLAYIIGASIHNRTKSHIANPILISCIFIIGLLVPAGIPYESYSQGAKYVSFLLGPATVALAVPMYRNFKLISKNKVAILAGILCGSVTGVISASLIAAALGADKVIAISLSPKSVTSPIAMEVSRILGGYPSLTAALVIVTGVIGAMIGPELLKFTGVKNKIAIGVAVGTASHALGTTRAIEEGEEIGAMSSLAIGIAGIITSLAAPIIIRLLF